MASKRIHPAGQGKRLYERSSSDIYGNSIIRRPLTQSRATNSSRATEASSNFDNSRIQHSNNSFSLERDIFEDEDEIYEEENTERVNSLYDCVKNGVLMVKDAVIYIERMKDEKRFSQAALDITEPPDMIKKYSVRINDKYAKDKTLISIPHTVQSKLLSFVEDLFGMGLDELRPGSMADLRNSPFYLSLGSTDSSRSVALKEKQRELQELRADAFRALQKSLKDIRSYGCEYSEEGEFIRWIANNRQAKRARHE